MSSARRGGPAVSGVDQGFPLGLIDWAAPWLVPFRECGEDIARQVQSGISVCQALTGSPLSPVRFVPQTDLPLGTAYEHFIFNTGCVPTRDGLHDFFNGLMWMRFPATKRLLNRLQASDIQRCGVGRVRGPVRDGLTLFDENAALLQAPEALWEALIARDWERLFLRLRPLWAQARLVLFGHALMEKLVAPYKAITAHVYRVPVPLALGSELGAWDGWLAARLTAADLGTKPFTPLPVLGVPGWWSTNEATGFYADAAVFRPNKGKLQSD